jgi:hypothetical protein
VAGAVVGHHLCHDTSARHREVLKQHAVLAALMHTPTTIWTPRKCCEQAKQPLYLPDISAASTAVSDGGLQRAQTPWSRVMTEPSCLQL